MKHLLFVAGFGGPPLDFGLPRVKALGKLHVLYSDTLAKSKIEAIGRHADVQLARPFGSEAELEQHILEAIDSYRIDAVLTLDEFSIGPVSRSAHERGLRGAGPHIHLARNKWAMRNAFEAAGVRNPRFRRVRNLHDLETAAVDLRLPAVLKPTEGAASIGHTILRTGDNLQIVWEHGSTFLHTLATERTVGAIEGFSEPEFILEEFIEASTASWYDDATFGDLVSVEGLVVRGVYHPIAVTSKYPLAPPFTEVGQITPCVLPLAKQLPIVDFARRAVDAQQLDTCATHTEMKLQANGELCMVESAARTPGALMTRQILEVFGVDMIDLLSRALLGETIDVPPLQYQPVHGAAGPVAIISLTPGGEPWRHYPRINKALDLRSYLNPAVEFEIAWGSDYEDGEPVKPYDPKLGTPNYIANVFLKAPTVELLIEAQQVLMNQSEHIFAAQSWKPAKALKTT